MKQLAPKVIGGLLGLLVLLWIGNKAARTLYFDERAALQVRIDEADRFLTGADSDRIELRGREQELQAFVDGTLGPRWEVVDSALRDRLNDLGREAGLEKLTVNTDGPNPKTSPARKEYARKGQRHLRKEPDFFEVEGRLTGEGTLEQVLRLAHRIESEPWRKRIDHLRLDGKDEGRRVAINLRLTTLYLPGLGPESPLPLSDTVEESGTVLAIMEASPFRIIPAPPPEDEVPEPGFPYGDWSITGVVAGPTGPEVWLRNLQSGDVRRLAVGDRISHLVLAATAGDAAEFREGPQRFRVVVGQSLSQRTPLPQ